MANWKYFYLIRIEFLGFRYHGWQKQPNQKTIHLMIDKTVQFVLDDEKFKTLGCGRTDSKVSADDYAFELFTNENLHIEKFLSTLNINLPADIRAKSVQAVDNKFNIIQDVKMKEYHYHFSFGNKSHPFNAPFIRDFGKTLNIDKMKEAALLFKGLHNFKRYVTKPAPTAVFDRELLKAVIEPNEKFTGSFTPKNAFVFKVKSKGFMRYQVRAMMGALVDVGRGVRSIEDHKQTLIDYNGSPVQHIAPSSGLALHKVEF